MIALATITPKMKFWKRDESAIRGIAEPSSAASFHVEAVQTGPAVSANRTTRLACVRRLVYGRANPPKGEAQCPRVTA